MVQTTGKQKLRLSVVLLREFPSLNLLAKIDYFESEGDGPAAQNRGTFDRESFDFSIDLWLYSNQIWTTSLTATVDIGPGTLTNIFGHRDYEAETGADIDALPSFIFHSDTDTAQSQISNEIAMPSPWISSI